MRVNKADYEYCIEVENGKYHVVLTKDYHVKFLRGGEDWVDSPPGSKMLIALMAKVERMEDALEFYADEKNYDELAHMHGDIETCIMCDEGEIAREALKNDD